MSLVGPRRFCCNALLAAAGLGTLAGAAPARAVTVPAAPLHARVTSDGLHLVATQTEGSKPEELAFAYCRRASKSVVESRDVLFQKRQAGATETPGGQTKPEKLAGLVFELRGAKLEPLSQCVVMTKAASAERIPLLLSTEGEASELAQCTPAERRIIDPTTKGKMAKCLTRALDDHIKLVHARWVVGKVERLRTGILNKNKLRIDAIGDDLEPVPEYGPTVYDILAVFRRSDGTVELWTQTAHHESVTLRWSEEQGDGFKVARELALYNAEED